MISGGGVIVMESKRRDLQAYPETYREAAYEKFVMDIVKVLAVVTVLVFFGGIGMFLISMGAL